VRARWLAPQQALLFERTPRLPGEAALHMAHFLAETDPLVHQLRGQTDRQLWRGRNRDASQPAARCRATAHGVERRRGWTPGWTRCACCRCTLRIAAGGKARLTFATAAAVDQAATLQAVIDKYRQASHVERASLMSATLAGGAPARDCDIGAEDLAAIQR
jgi:cyclic beta-1,2-glucan synthetase